MSLTPEDIQSKQFHVRFRGFDVEEVDGFLEQVAENLLMLMEENRTLKARMEAMTKDLEVFKQDEVTFKNAILSAQKVADEMKKKSRSEANRLLMQTSAEVAQLRDEANREIAGLEARVDHLKGTQARLTTDLRGVLNRYLEQLDNPEEILPMGEGPQEPLSGEVKRPQPLPRRVEVDPSPLYEKISLDDEDEDFLKARAEAEYRTLVGASHEPRLSGPSVGGLDIEGEEEEGPSVSLPDIDDDEIMFSLDDPLDQEGGRKRR